MNIGQLKFLSWLAAGVLTACLAFYVFTFVRGFKELNKQLDIAKIDAVLTQGEPVQIKADEITSYEDIRRLVLPSCEKCRSNPNCKHLNWTGSKKVVVEAKPDDGAQSGPPRTPVRDLVRISFVMLDGSEAASSVAFLKYKPEAKVSAKSAMGLFKLKVGDPLHSPLEKIKIEAITEEGVTFSFSDVSRENETLVPAEFDSKTAIYVVDADNVIQPKLSGGIVKRAEQIWNPERTSPIGSNGWQLGTEDVKEFERSWDRILVEDIRHERHKDPRTGRYDGIEIKSVTPGSIAERHGVQSGDVIKSINGHPVTSVSEAVQFAKNHKDQYTTWEVVVENRGRTRTMTYRSPSR